MFTVFDHLTIEETQANQPLITCQPIQFPVNFLSNCATVIMSSNDSDGGVPNERNLPVELQTPHIVHPAYQAIVTPNAVNGQGAEVMAENNGEPCVSIVEQPQQRGFRFRYECEGPSHGGLQGINSARGKKTYPSIKIENYTGAARVVVTLVTEEENPRCHAHKLVGTNCKNGQGTMEIPANTEPISFPNLCILHVTRKKLVDVLTERIKDTIKLGKKLKAHNMNFEPEITDDDRRLAQSQAKEQSKTMQLNVVRLCFQVFLRNPDGSFGKMLNPVVSQPIFDSKAPGTSALKICRMDKYGGCCSGNEEVFLLCEKVQKDDIQVRFVEQSSDGKVQWESMGNFGPLDVHRQYAIVFKTPPYWNTNIEKAVNVFIMLQRRSDQEVSEPIAFTYFPQNRDKDNIASKKRKRIPLDAYDFGGDGGGYSGCGFGGDGGGGSGNDMDDGSGGGGGGMRGGGGQQTNKFIVMQNAEMPLQRNILPTHVNVSPPKNVLPTPVEEVIMKKYTPTNIPSHATYANINLQPSHDLWFEASPDNVIEVDSDSTVATSRDHNFSVPNSPLPPVSSALKSEMSSSQLETDNVFDDRDIRKDKCSIILASNDWLDSGVDTHSSKSSIFFDEKKEKKDSLHTDGYSTTSSVSGSHGRTPSESDEKKTIATKSSVSESHSEADTKGGYTTGKSDEGFSETSEEAASKKKQTVSKEKSVIQTSSSTTTTSSSTPKSDLIDTFRTVTQRITDRTVLALRDYAETGNTLHLLLVQRHLMAVSNNNGDLPLHLGIINSQTDAVKSLLKIMGTLPESKSHINAFNLMRQTPLHLATILGQQSVVEFLLHAGADPSIADRNGNTPAHLAVMNKTEPCLMSLVKYVRPGTTKFNPFPELNYLNYEGFSPVHIAAMDGDVSMLRRLMFGKADLDLPDGKSGKTSLHHAVDNDDLAVAKYLLMENYCDVNARCFDGNTALHIACARQRVGMVALLVSAGADVDIENEEIPDPLTIYEDGSKRNRRGHLPMDYADGNEKILSILYKDYEGLESSYYSIDSLGSGSLYHQMGGMSIQDSGTVLSSLDDLKSVSLKSRIELSKMLDHEDKDVFALAEKLNYSNLTSALKEMIKAKHSPTTFLLEYFESQKGSLKILEESLVAIGRSDVAALLQSSSTTTNITSTTQ